MRQIVSKMSGLVIAIFCILLLPESISLLQHLNRINDRGYCIKSTRLFNGLKRPPSNRDKRIQNILDIIDYSRDRNSAEIPVALLDDPLVPLVETIVRAADKRKASFISAFRVFQLTEVTTFMITIEGNSKPQNQAIANAIEEDLEVEFKETPYSKEGTAASGWLLLDYGSIMVHIMTPQMRKFYKLEQKWKDAESMDVSHLITPNEGGTGSTYTPPDEDLDPEMQKLGEDIDKEDPFWS